MDTKRKFIGKGGKTGRGKKKLTKNNGEISILQDAHFLNLT